MTAVLGMMMAAARSALLAALSFRAFVGCLTRRCYRHTSFFAACCLAFSLDCAAGLALLGLIA